MSHGTWMADRRQQPIIGHAWTMPTIPCRAPLPRFGRELRSARFATGGGNHRCRQRQVACDEPRQPESGRNPMATVLKDLREKRAFSRADHWRFRKRAFAACDPGIEYAVERLNDADEKLRGRAADEGRMRAVSSKLRSTRSELVDDLDHQRQGGSEDATDRPISTSHGLDHPAGLGRLSSACCRACDRRRTGLPSRSRDQAVWRRLPAAT